MYITDLVVAEHREHDAGEDHDGFRRSRRGTRRHGEQAPRREAQQVLDDLERSASPTTTWSTYSRSEGVEKFEASWTELVASERSSRSSRPLSAPRSKRRLVITDLRPNPLRDPQDRRLPRIAGPCVLVIFGVTGDLSTKKLMPAVYDLANRGLLPPGLRPGRVRSPRLGAPGLRHRSCTTAVKQHARTPFREEVWQQLSEGIRFVPGEIGDEESFNHLAETIADLDEARGTGGNHAFYLSIPPGLFQTVVDQLRSHGLAEQHPGRWSRVVIEKPFGHDLASARELNRIVSSVFPSSSVFRIDHYLGKETVQNMMALRFANRAVRAGVEQQLRRPCPDHDGRGHRHRRSRRLLRRHRDRPRCDPEPPAPAAGADSDGGTQLLRGQPAPGREAEGAGRRSTAEANGPAHRARDSTPAAGRAERRSRVIWRRIGSHRTHGPRPTPRSASTSTTAGGRACRSTCVRESGWPDG